MKRRLADLWRRYRRAVAIGLLFPLGYCAGSTRQRNVCADMLDQIASDLRWVLAR